MLAGNGFRAPFDKSTRMKGNSFSWFDHILAKTELRNELLYPVIFKTQISSYLPFMLSIIKQRLRVQPSFFCRVKV